MSVSDSDVGVERRNSGAMGWAIPPLDSSSPQLSIELLPVSLAPLQQKFTLHPLLLRHPEAKVEQAKKSCWGVCRCGRSADRFRGNRTLSSLLNFFHLFLSVSTWGLYRVAYAPVAKPRSELSGATLFLALCVDQGPVIRSPVLCPKVLHLLDPF